MQKTKALLWLIIFAFSMPVDAATVIRSISYEGNKVTRAEVMNREIYIREGDVLNEAEIEKSRQAIMDLGLFKSVHYYINDSTSSQQFIEGNKQLDLVFVVEEKYYLIILPRARANDDEVHLGMQVRWDNVAGYNHSMRLLLEDRGDTSGVDETRKSLSYYYPNINNSPYNIDIEWLSINDVDETDGVINRQDDEYIFSMSRWLNERGRNRGWLVGGSIKYQERHNEVISGEQFSDQQDAVVVGMEASYTSISEYEYNRGGKYYSYRIDISDERLGSDAEFTRHQFTYRSYYPIAANPLSNLNVQTKLGHANQDVLGDSAFSLGSSDDLRGYENDRFNGNTVLLTNVEYMFPHPGYPLVRYLYFVDIGNAYDAFDEILHKPLNVGAGFGLRWKIRAFVKLDLRADVGYGFTDEDYRFSFGTRHAF